MMVEMICAGFGGQGVLTTGLILAEAGMKLGMNVLWYPSYGSEMRGGTANCTIKFSDKEIASPCAKKIDILMAMNAPAIDKFESSLRPGGLLAVTYTDIVQMALLLLGIVVLAVPLVGSQLHKMGANLVTDLPASFFDLGAWGWPTILALGLSTIMSFFTSMDSYTRCIAAKDARTARTGTIYAAVLVLIIAGTSTFLGMAGKLILPGLSSSNNVIAALVVELFPHGLKGLVLIGVLSAIMSTADISVLTGSASLTKDIYQRYINPNASDKTLLRVGFGASLFVGVLGAIFGWFTQDIMNILLITFTINSAGLFLPTLGAFFWKKSCSAGAFASMLSATVIAVVWFIGGKVSSLPLFSIDALWPSFGVSAILYVVICLTHHQTPAEQETAEKFYAAK